MPAKPKKTAPRIIETPVALSARATAAALYHRVSTRDQDPTIARAELQAAAKARGLTVALSVEETGSGAKNDRLGLQRVLEAAHKGEISAVLVWKLDRFGRSTSDLLNNINALSAAGARFICTSQSIDVKPGGGDPMSNLLLTILAGVAEFERSATIERIALGIAAARKAGKHLGRPRALDAPAARQAHAARASGLSWGATAKKLGCTVAMARRRFAEAA